MIFQPLICAGLRAGSGTANISAPFGTCLTSKGDAAQCKKSGRLYKPSERWLQWVGRYEVRYRIEGGRQWHLLGTFKGNVDATSEVVHAVRGLRARYLRITPLEVEGKGALRVGIYGEPLASATAVLGAALSADGGSNEAPEPISYTLRTCPDGMNKRWTYCEKYTYQGGARHRSMYWRRSGSTRWEKRLELLREWREHDLEHTEDEMESDDEDTTGEATSTAPACPLVNTWAKPQQERRGIAARMVGIEDAHGHDDGALSECWSDGEWPSTWSEEAWSEVVWPELSVDEPWLHVAAFRESHH